MRRLLALLLVAPALAAAQPSAADSALVDEVVDALQVTESVGASMGPVSQGLPSFLTDQIDQGTIEDSLRSLFYADFRRAALQDALVFLDGPTYEALLEWNRRQAEMLTDPVAMAAFQERLLNPKKGALADEALVRRYVDALGMVDLVPEMMGRMFMGLSEAVPEIAAEMEAEGGFDAVLEQFDADAREQMDSTYVASMRVSLYGVPRDQLTEVIAFHESDAGRYVNQAAAAATMSVVIPALVEFMTGMYTAFSELENDGDDIQIYEIPESPPPPSAERRPAPTEPEIFEVVEVQPELIGGLEGLQQRVVYPEAARRAGVEGQVVIQFVVDEEGAVVDPVVLRSPNDLLSEAALAAVVGSRFTPGMQEGRPVKVRFAVPVTFRLHDPAPPKKPTSGQ